MIHTAYATRYNIKFYYFTCFNGFRDTKDHLEDTTI